MAWCDVVEPCTLRECRIALGQSQAAVAAELGASPESYRMWDAGRRAPPPKVLARARALATHRDDHELLPLPVLALLVGVHVKTLRPRRQRAAAGRRCWRRSLPSCCERGRSPPGWHGGGRPRSRGPLRAAREIRREARARRRRSACWGILPPASRHPNANARAGSVSGSQVTRSGPISWHREGDVSGTLRI